MILTIAIGKLVIPEYENCQKDYAEGREEFKAQHGGKDLAEFTESMLTKASAQEILFATLIESERIHPVTSDNQTHWKSCVFEEDKDANRIEEANCCC